MEALWYPITYALLRKNYIEFFSGRGEQRRERSETVSTSNTQICSVGTTLDENEVGHVNDLGALLGAY